MGSSVQLLNLFVSIEVFVAVRNFPVSVLIVIIVLPTFRYALRLRLKQVVQGLQGNVLLVVSAHRINLVFFQGTWEEVILI